MCRSIKVLRGPGIQPTKAEIAAASLQFVRKVSGFQKPSKKNQAAFEAAVAEITRVTGGLLEEMTGEKPVELLDRVAVHDSPAHGKGVFACAAFAKGDAILALDDSHVVDNAHPVPAGEEHHRDFLEGGKVVWMQTPECFINHSCDPNVFVQTRGGVRYVVARRSIAIGEEICYDYCVNSSGDTVWTCHCGATNCRNQIHSDFFHLPFDKQAEYLPLLDAWFQRERADDVETLKSEVTSRSASQSAPATREHARRSRGARRT